MSDQYAASIRHSYTMPDETFYGYELVLWHYHESRKVRTTLTVYRLQCPRGHISTSWFSHAALASRQWKELVDEYKGKDTK